MNQIFSKLFGPSPQKKAPKYSPQPDRRKQGSALGSQVGSETLQILILQEETNKKGHTLLFQSPDLTSSEHVELQTPNSPAIPSKNTQQRSSPSTPTMDSGPRAAARHGSSDSSTPIQITRRDSANLGSWPPSPRVFPHNPNTPQAPNVADLSNSESLHTLGELAFGSMPLAVQDGITTKIHRISLPVCAGGALNNSEAEFVVVTSQFSYRVKPASAPVLTKSMSETAPRKPSHTVTTACIQKSLDAPNTASTTHASQSPPASSLNLGPDSPTRTSRSSSYSGSKKNPFLTYLKNGWKKNFAILCLFPIDSERSQDSNNNSNSEPESPNGKSFSSQMSPTLRKNFYANSPVGLPLSPATPTFVALPFEFQSKAESGLLAFVKDNFILFKFRMRLIFSVLQRVIKTHVVASTQKRQCPGFKPLELQQEQQLVDIVVDFQNVVSDLYSFPKLEKNIWLHSLHATDRDPLFSAFIDAFTQIYIKNSLIVNALTGILAIHRTWIATLTHPFAAMFFDSQQQLNQIYGDVTLSRGLSKCIVLGKNRKTVSNYLTILSYFIRCGKTANCQQISDISLLDIPRETSNTTQKKGESFLENEQFFPGKVGIDFGQGGQVLRPSSLGAGAHLFGSIGPRYTPGLALFGMEASFAEFLEPLFEDLKLWTQKPLVSTNVIPEAGSCLIVDTDKASSHLVMFSPRSTQHYVYNEKTFQGFSVKQIQTADLVLKFSKRLNSLSHIGLPPTTCVEFVEDFLKQTYQMAMLVCQALLQIVEAPASENTSPQTERDLFAKVVSNLGLQKQDVPFLVAIGTSEMQTSASQSIFSLLKRCNLNSEFFFDQ